MGKDTKSLGLEALAGGFPRIPDANGYEMLGKKYTTEFKLEKVREYLEKIENGEKISKMDFAYQNSLSDFTFNDWVVKYQKMGKEFANMTEQITLLTNNVVEKAPRIIRFDGVVQGELPKDIIRVTFNGITVEFSESLTERVMEILRKW